MEQAFSNKMHILLITLGFLLTALFGYGHFIDGDVIQILDKAHIFVTQGVLTPYGNLSTSGASGSTPGAFLTLVTGLPMKLWFSPWAALTFLALLHFVAYLMFYDVLKKYLDPRAMIFVVVLFWLNPWRLSEVFLWNPGYIYFVAVFHMWSAYYLAKEKSFWFSFLHAQSLFLGLQVHTSFVILFFITMMLLWTRSMRPHLGGVIVGILFGLLTLVPYFLAGLEDPRLFPQPGSGDGKGFLFFGLVAVYPMLKGFWYWILFGSNIFQTHVFHQVHFDWLGEGSLFSFIMKYFWVITKYTLGTFGVLLSFYVNFQFYKKYKSHFNLFRAKMTSPQNWLVFYTICAFFSALIATAISPTLAIYWHLLMVWPMTLTPLLLFFNHCVKTKEGRFGKRIHTYFWILVVYFTCANAFAALGSKKHNIHQSFHDLYFKACQERCTMENLNNN